MGMICKFDHVGKQADKLGGTTFEIKLKLETDDPDIYKKVVLAISNSLGYGQPGVEEKQPVMGFHARTEDGAE